MALTISEPDLGSAGPRSPTAVPGKNLVLLNCYSPAPPQATTFSVQSIIEPAGNTLGFKNMTDSSIRIAF